MLLTLRKYIHDNRFFYCFLTVLLFLLFVIFYCSPPSADDLQLIVESSDWTHLVSATIRRYQQLNGRILGNMSIVYLLDHPIIDGIVRSGTLFGMIYLIYKRKEQLSLFDKISIFFLIITPLYCYGITNLFGKFYQLRWSVILLDVCLVLGYYVSLLWIGTKHIKETRLRNLLLFFTLSIFLVNAPMLLVLPLSLRCFYFPYVFMVMIFTIFFVDLEVQFHWNTRFLIPIIVLFTGIATFSYTYMMFENYRCEQTRNDIITTEMKKKKTKITIPNYPYPDLIECFGRDGRLNYRYQYQKFGDIEFYYR